MENEMTKKTAIEHEEGNDFNGIIKYLEGKYGNNLHQQKIVKITVSSSGYNRPYQVIDYNWKDHFYTSVSLHGQWFKLVLGSS